MTGRKRPEGNDQRAKGSGLIAEGKKTEGRDERSGGVVEATGGRWVRAREWRKEGRGEKAEER
jgi:hypothetical protein